MPRPVTYKKIQEHYQCVCGYNSVQQYEQAIHSMFLKRRVDKKDGGVWYLLQVKSKECNGDHYEHDEDDFECCSHCDLPDACADFGCAIKQGLKRKFTI